MLCYAMRCCFAASVFSLLRRSESGEIAHAPAEEAQPECVCFPFALWTAPDYNCWHFGGDSRCKVDWNHALEPNTLWSLTAGMVRWEMSLSPCCSLRWKHTPGPYGIGPP
ncbi:uncharacterized protein BDZ83DRAFT_640568 [Colletotrichum acutatum]|uniref:Uncharacterized protein n=1 Tax=Glomerella acutata TaxID=27357 RepID=A0AAD8X993_GLOAC|nr:uncharacterized protein BDZ83DRAFT_640568 [Colletotrichum acutatum]KAK1710352.1 hypothetical protein BDZ83DRAFT_640568 [Colletotrichum acutatum]